MEQNGRPELSKNREAKDLPDKGARVCRPDAADRVFERIPGFAGSDLTGAEEFMRRTMPRFAVISGDKGFSKGFSHGEIKRREMGLVEAADQAHGARGEDKCVI